MKAEKDHPRTEAVELRLLDELAGFVKYSGIYPANNGRVRQACAGFFTAFEWVKQEHGSRVLITLERDRFHVAGVRIEDETPVIRWLREVFVQTVLGGIKLDANVQRWSLAKFANQMSENCAFAEGTFSGFWSKQFPGIQPLELRYAGGPDVAAGRDQVVHELMQNDELMAKVDYLRKMLARNIPVGESAQLNLLEPIRRALPIEAVRDPKTACRMVDKILDVLHTKVQAMVAREEFTENELMQVAIARVGQRFFKANVKDMVPPPLETLPEGRPEDAAIIDDVDLMLAEYEALPEREQCELDIFGLELVRETLGALVHTLVRADSDKTAAADQIRKILADQPELADLLIPYVECCASEDGLLEQNRGNWRVIELLQESDPLGILRGRGFLTPRSVQFTFPRQFIPYVDGLGPDDTAGLATLADICADVGADAIELSGEYLLQKGLVTRKRIKKILGVDSDHLLPLVRVVAAISDDWVRDAVCRFIRRRNPPLEESAALRVVRPLGWLSTQYLQGLCVLHPAEAHCNWLREESARLLRVFLRNTARRPELRERRIRAVHMLCALPSEENIDILGEVINERRLRIFHWTSTGLRRAARRARKQMRKKLAKGRE